MRSIVDTSAARTSSVIGIGGLSEKKGKELADEHGGRDNRRPEALLVADGGLCDVLGAHDLIRQPVHFFLLVPALVGIEVEAERRREHFRGQLLGIVAGDVFALAEAMVLGKVTVQLAVAWN